MANAKRKARRKRKSAREEPKRVYKTALIVEAIHRARGMVTAAATLLGCDRRTIQKRAKTDPEIREALDGARCAMLDRAELQLFKAIDEGKPWAICFYLKCQGKDRGYIERPSVTIEGGDGKPAVMVTFVDAVPPEGEAAVEAGAEG